MKDIIDTNTFEVINSYYWKDSTRLYSVYYLSNSKNIVYDYRLEVDLKTFEIIKDSEYARDKNHIFFRGRVAEIDRETFIHLGGCCDFDSFDENHLYFYGKRLSQKKIRWLALDLDKIKEEYYSSF